MPNKLHVHRILLNLPIQSVYNNNRKKYFVKLILYIDIVNRFNYIIVHSKQLYLIKKEILAGT